MMEDPRVLEYREALADVNAGLRAPQGAHERYRHALGPYVECMAEHTPDEPSFVRPAMMSALFRAGLPLGVILGIYKATEAEGEYVAAHPPVVSEPVDEQDRLARLPYGVYLKTAHWQKVRTDALRRAEGRCALCNSAASLQVHHRTYDRRGAERPADVIVMCDPCHNHHHEHLKAA